MLIDYDPNNIWHVVPVNDLKPHTEEGFSCECGPKVQMQENKGVVVTHKAYDHREYFENEKTK